MRPPKRAGLPDLIWTQVLMAVHEPLDEDLYTPAARLLSSVESGTQHPRIVEHHEIPTPQYTRKLDKLPIRDGATRCIQTQQTARSTPRQGMLGDQMPRQAIGERAPVHRARDHSKDAAEGAALPTLRVVLCFLTTTVSTINR